MGTIQQNECRVKVDIKYYFDSGDGWNCVVGEDECQEGLQENK